MLIKFWEKVTFISEGTALQDLRFLLRTVIQTEIPPKNGDVGAQKIKYLFFFSAKLSYLPGQLCLGSLHFNIFNK